jgi:hypothetical protein
VNTRAVLSELRELRRTVRDIEQGCERLIERLETEPRDGGVGMIDQTASDLGPKRHCAIVRRRIAENKSGAVIAGRRHMLSPEAYAEECGTRFRPLAKVEARHPASAPHNDNHEGDNDEVAAALARLSRRLGR